jgi:cytochrome c5
MSLKLLLPVLFVLSAALLPFEATSQPKARPQATAKASTKQTAATSGSVHQDEGQRIFDQNCSRCHTAPDGFSPRISGTVVRHMRVRASLSQHDEQELLRFLNP